jgi:sialidase-1
MLFLILLNNACKSKKMTISMQIPDSVMVFEPKAGEYASMRIPALVLTKKNTLLAFCEGRINNASDWGAMDILMRRSTDGGRSWLSAAIIANHIEGQPTSNATPIVDNEGKIHLIYQRDYAKAYYISSQDDGLTWSEPVDITGVFEQFKPEYNWKVLTPGPGHAIQLKNGRLLVPVWLSDSEKLLPHRSHSPSCVATIYSDDMGKTWKRGAIAAANSPELKNPNETMAVQLDDGKVMLNIRSGSEVHRRAVCYSADGIRNWSKPVYDDELFDPVCMASIIKVPGKHVLLFINPDSHDLPKFPRRNLTAKLSHDDGQTWPVHRLIHNGLSGYSDVAVDDQGMVYCLFETNLANNFNYSIMLKRFNIKWITGGRSYK